MTTSDIKTELVSSLTSINHVLEGVVQIVDQQALSDPYLVYKEQLNELAKEDFLVAITGTVSAGKSTFVNALLGKNILPRLEKTTTKVATKIRSVSHSPNQEECYVARIKYPHIPSNFDQLFYQKLDEYRANPENNIKYLDFFQYNIWNRKNIRRSYLISLFKGIREPFSFSEDKDGFQSLEFLIEIFNETQQVHPIYDAYKEITGSVDKLEPILTNSLSTSYKTVTDVTVYLDAPILSRGVTLVDLPGSDARFARDEEITHGILQSEALSAVIFVYRFGEDPRKEDDVISELIKVNSLSRKNKLFLVFNKTDTAIHSQEKKNNHLNETLAYFQEKFSGFTEDRIEYFYLSAALNEGFSFGIDPSGQPLKKVSTIKKELNTLAERDLELKQLTQPEAYENFFNAFADCLSQLPSVQRELTGSNHQQRVMTAIGKLTIQEMISIYNLEGLNELITYIKPKQIGMTNLYNSLFAYLREGRIIDGYERVLKSWNDMMSCLHTVFSETTIALDSYGNLKEYRRSRERRFREAMSNIQSSANQITQTFHRQTFDQVESEVENLLEKFNDRLTELLKSAIDDISYDDIVASLKSDYWQPETIPNYLSNFANSHDLKGYEDGFKQENIYTEAILLALIHALQIMTRYKAKEMINEIPMRIIDHLGSWLVSEESHNLYFKDLFDAIGPQVNSLHDDLGKVIADYELDHKTFDGLRNLSVYLYHQGGINSIYAELLNSEELDGGLETLSNLNEETNFTQIKRLLEEIHNKQLERGFEKFQDVTMRFLRDWPRAYGVPFIEYMFEEEGALFEEYWSILNDSLEQEHMSEMQVFDDLCSMLQKEEDEIDQYLVQAESCYKKLSVKFTLRELRNFTLLGDPFKKLLKKYAEVKEDS